MEVSCPVLSSQHTGFHPDNVGRHSRLPLQESTGNVQSHASTAASTTAIGSLVYCSPPSVAVTSSASSTSLPLSSCTPVNSSPTSIPASAILPSQSLDGQQPQHQGQPSYGYHSTQQQQQQQQQPPQPSYYGSTMVKPLPSQPYQQPYSHHHQQQQHQQQLMRRQSAHHHGSLTLAGGLAGSSLLSGGLGAGTGRLGAGNNDINPIYLSPQFQAYRKKQAEKDDKTEQIWPDVLEDAFLDALLLIPQMGRKKYAMRGQLHGRNMLISEYLWVAYCLSLPLGAKPDRKMARGRKQVSSHIQVLKNFFIHHRCYHFFFPSKEKKEDTRRELADKESFKDNPVLRALFEGRLPNERPNYEYFGQLLASDALVALRPSLCWILVSSAAVRYEGEGPRRGEAFRASDGQPLDGRLYPHLHLNAKREEWPERGKIIRGTLLQEYTRALSQKEASSVREISQDWEERFPGRLCDALDNVVRSDLRDILHYHVTLDVQEPDRFPEGSELNSLVEVTIEQPGLQNHRWKSVTRLARPWELMAGRPEDDTETGPDEVPVSVITREIGSQYVHRPSCQAMLHGGNTSGGGSGHCDCYHQAGRMRRQQLAVPFPAPEWATMLSMLTGYRKHPLEDDGEGATDDYYGKTGGGSGRASSKKSSVSAASSGKRSSYGSTTTSVTAATTVGGGDDIGDDSFTSTSSHHSGGSGGSSHAGGSGSGGAPTQMDLVRNIAMLQELWSCGPSSSSVSADGSSSGGSSSPTQWVRRAVILWTFETVYSINERKMEVVKTPAGTGWRFLTTIDPASQYHQQQALVLPGGGNNNSNNSGGSSQVQQSASASLLSQPPPSLQLSLPTQQALGCPTRRRDGLMSPHPGYQQHLQAAMSEHLSTTAWDPSMYRPQPIQQQQQQAPRHSHPSISPQPPATAQAPFQVPPAMGLLDTTFGAASGGLPSPYATAFDSQPGQHPQSSQSYGAPAFSHQLTFMASPDAESVVSVASSGGHVRHHPHHQPHHQPQHQPQHQHQPHQQHQQPPIDPFLAAGGPATSPASHASSSAGAGGPAVTAPQALPDWDANDMTTALGGWPVTAAGSEGMSAGVTAGPAPDQAQVRGQKRGRSDSLDGTSGYPVASMPKLSHGDFSSWR